MATARSPLDPTILTLPLPHRTLDAAMDDGATIRIRRHGNPDGPRIVLSHGNGCAIDGYYPFWGLLLDACDVVVFDFRNAGWNPPHPGAHGYDRFVADLDAVYDAIDGAFGRKRQIGVFHSMSARANLKHALGGASRLDGLVVVDPPMVPPPGHPLHETMLREERVLWRWAQDRPDGFDDPADLADLFAKSRMLSGWVDGAYGLMARSVLRRDESSGKWRLVCPGPLEAAVYRENAELNIWPQVGEFPMPLLLLASDPDSGIPSAPAHAATALRDECGWPYVRVPGTGHFLQLQAPDVCAALVQGFLREIGMV